MQKGYERGIKKTRMIKGKQESKQKVVFARDKYRFGLNFHNFTVFKHGRRTSKQDSCMDM